LITADISNRRAQDDPAEEEDPQGGRFFRE